ncbi:MAG: phosphoribosylformylglycinamidine synthase subunit PurQ [Vampirovibrionales bacterium]|nr:phosphoribosylformylglycinamidine synthase subunit PurQ [Vampirovibrionales bacterium]
MARLRIGVVRFPGSNCEQDCLEFFNDPEWADAYGVSAEYLWHQSGTIDAGIDAVILPGGFSYGDTLRSGALASLSPILRAVKEVAAQGKPVLGICNGFQMLTESGLLPGALQLNRQGGFLCEAVALTLENRSTFFTQGYSASTGTEEAPLVLPIAHAEGNYTADEATLEALHVNNQVVFQYTSDINGSAGNIAGICNKPGNVLGLMPHPERALYPTATTTADGRKLFESLLQHLSSHTLAPCSFLSK